MEKLYTIAARFAKDGAVQKVEAYGAGNVNDTYLVTGAPGRADGLNGASTPQHFIMQRVNTHVFRRPELILLNMRTFLDHMAARQQYSQPGVQTGATSTGRDPWQMPHVIATQDGQDSWQDDEGDFWRAISLVENAKSYASIRNAAHAREAGYALGRFHNLLSDLDPARLHDTLPGFHITPGYLTTFDAVLAEPSTQQRLTGNRAAEVERALHFVEARRGDVDLLEAALRRGELKLRAIHGDPKVDNILIDNTTDQAISIIDLDTVKPGLVHYDIGDCLRSCCNPAGEETLDLDSITFDAELCRAILEGYLAEAADFFTAADYAYVYDAIRLITFELGLRFFTDYLAGDRYFKTRYPDHNLQRALVQFRLAACVENAEQVIRQIVSAQQKKALS